MRSQEFGRVQMRIMQALWKMKRATAREITEAINEYEPITHSTVQIIIRTLEAKKAITHDAQGRTFIYYPLIQQENAVRNATSEFVNRVFNGSMEGLAVYLAKGEDISREEKKRFADTLISRLFEGSAEDLVAYLIDNRYIAPEALQRLCDRNPEPEES
jgi:BlaI family transcriptional regulator, penicillinase repressor